MIISATEKATRTKLALADNLADLGDMPKFNLSVAPTSVKNWRSYVSEITRQGLPTAAFHTRIRLVPDNGTMFKMEFFNLAPVADILAEPIIAMIHERQAEPSHIIPEPPEDTLFKIGFTTEVPTVANSDDIPF